MMTADDRRAARERLTCGKPIKGLYGADTFCARPFNHGPTHTIHDGIHWHPEWEDFFAALAGSATSSAAGTPQTTPASSDTYGAE